MQLTNDALTSPNTFSTTTAGKARDAQDDEILSIFANANPTSLAAMRYQACLAGLRSVNSIVSDSSIPDH